MFCTILHAKAQDLISDALNRSTLKAHLFTNVADLFEFHSGWESECCMSLIPAKVKVTVGGHKEISEPWMWSTGFIDQSREEKLATWAIQCSLMDHSSCISVSQMALCVHVFLSMYFCEQRHMFRYIYDNSRVIIKYDYIRTHFHYKRVKTTFGNRTDCLNWEWVSKPVLCEWK